MLDFFYMFDTENDLSRAGQLTAPEGARTFATPSVTDYEMLNHRPDDDVRSWIDEHLTRTSCLVVLIGEQTHAQRWVTYAMGMARHLDIPMIGVTIDKLADADGDQGVVGPNPFTNAGMSARALAALEIYDPPFATSAFARAHIRYTLPDWVELAVREHLWRNGSRSRRQVRREQEQQKDAS